jgi:hypothetical protein
MRRRHGGRRARMRGRARLGADFNLLTTAVNLARLATLGLTDTAGRGWALNPSRTRRWTLRHRLLVFLRPRDCPIKTQRLSRDGLGCPPRASLRLR